MPEVKSDTSEIGIATINPYRYRGYYYDNEIGMYYLQSRYYNPVVGRFVNADEVVQLDSPSGLALFAIIGSLFSYKRFESLFVYCHNNSIERVDAFGYASYSNSYQYISNSKRRVTTKIKFWRTSLTYKYYIDNLMKPKELTGEDVLKLQTIFNNKQLQLNDAIGKCMEIISDITNYTSVVLGANSADNLLRQVSIIPLDENKVVALICTDKGVVENKQFILPPNTEMKEVVKTCEIINKLLIGTPICDISKRLEFEIKPIISKQIKEYEAIYNIFYDSFKNFMENSSNVHVNGKVKLLDQPEYKNADDMKRIIKKLENDEFIKNAASSDSEGIKIYIGDESEFDENATVIKSKYNINGEEGTIAIIGPKRMEYARVVGLMKYINDYIALLGKDDDFENR